MKSDEQLIEDYLESKGPAAVDALAQRYLVPVRSIIYPMVLDQSLADDLTQEVFLRAFRGLRKFQKRSKFSTWLYKIAVNTARSYLDRRNRSPVSFRSDVPERCTAVDDSQEQKTMHAETVSALEVAIMELSPKLRIAIVLTAIRQIDVVEAAEIEGCTQATMYWRIHEARKQLRKKLEGHWVS